MVDGAMIGLALSLSTLTYMMGVLMQTLPIPWRSLKAHGPSLMMDGVIGQIAIMTIGLVQLLVQWVSNLLHQSIGAPFDTSTNATIIIVTQLSSLIASLFLLIAALSTTVILAPVASALSSILGPMLTWTTVALIIWLIVEAILGFLPTIWIALYTLGVVFLAIPFRLGRRLGSTLMATSITLIIMLPFMPSLALFLEANLGYQTALQPLEDIIARSRSDPLALLNLIHQLPVSVGNLMVSVVLSLVIFPFAYFFIISMVARSLASLLGSNAAGPSVSSFVLTPAWEVGGRLTR